MPTYIPNERGELTALNPAADAFAESANQMVQTGDLGAAFAKMFLSLTVLVLLLVVSFWFLRRLIQNRMQKGGSDASIRVLEKRMISPKTMLYLVEVDRKKILLAESHLEIKRLESFEHT